MGCIDRFKKKAVRCRKVAVPGPRRVRLQALYFPRDSNSKKMVRICVDGCHLAFDGGEDCVSDGAD